MGKIEYSYDGFAMDIESWDYVYPAYPTLSEELRAVLPHGATFEPLIEDGEETGYSVVRYGDEYMYVLYDDGCEIDYDPITEKKWGEVIETTLAKMHEVNMAVFGESWICRQDNVDWDSDEEPGPITEFPYPEISKD